MKKTLTTLSTAFALVFALSGLSFSAAPDWDAADSKKVTLFYPGTASWEFLNSPDHGLGARVIKDAKKACIKCHISETGDYDIRAEEIASGSLKMKKSGKIFEPEPMENKKGFIDATVQAAYDSEYLYLKVEWASSGESARNESIAKDKLDRLSVQLNKGNAFFRNYGCFVTCHNDLRFMPESPSKDEVKKNPYYSALDRDSVKLYAFYTRNEGWGKIKDKKELASIKEDGFIDLWEAELKGQKTSTEDAWVFEDRQKDAKDDLKADAGWKNNKYSVVIKRKLKTNDDKDVSLSDGDTFSIGVAIHDNGAKFREHYVTFPFSIGLGAEGDLRAQKVK